MSKAKFVLKEPEAKEDTLIYLFFNFNYQRLKYSTGQKINPKYWNAEDQCATNTKKFPELAELNSRLADLSALVLKLYRQLINEGTTPTPDKLRLALDLELNKVERKGKPSLIKFISTFIENNKQLKSPNTIKGYTSTLNHLLEFQKAKRTTVDFDSITLDFYDRFISFLTYDLKMSQNSVGKYVKNLKTFLNEATDRGINDNLEFKKRKFKVLTEQTDKIYLTTADLDKLYELDLSKQKSLERVRDLFLIGCYTGLRFSDFTQLSPENILEGNKIRIRTAKTSEVVVIPLHRVVKEILKKYNNEIPKAISNQKMNEYLKDIGEKAKLTERVETTVTKAGELVKSKNYKHELISTHAARRSFATNLYMADVPAITIMKITGHRTERAFLQYIRVTQEQNANKLLEHPFFQ